MLSYTKYLSVRTCIFAMAFSWEVNLGSGSPATTQSAQLPALHQGMRLNAFMTHVDIPLGQLVGFQVRVENFNNPNGYYWAMDPDYDFHFDVRDVDGKAVPYTRNGAWLQDRSQGGPGNSTNRPLYIPVGQAWHFYFNLSSLFEFKNEGTYTVKASLDIENGSAHESHWNAPGSGHKDVPESLESNEVTFRIVKSAGGPATRESDVSWNGRVEVESIDIHSPSTQPDTKK